MGLLPYYEDSYRAEAARSVPDLLAEIGPASRALVNFVLDAKTRFLEGADWKGLTVLELGAGRGGVSLELARLGADVTLVDFSPSALEQAKRIFAAEGLATKAIVGDVTHPDLTLEGPFDLIIDSHLLHCLTDDADRTSFYQLVQDHLSMRGILVSETMVHRKKLQVPDGFMLDQRQVLHQMFGKWTPIRRILDSLDLEEELRSANFEIIYFMYYGQYGFVPHRSFMELPAEILPAAVRMVLKRRALAG